MLSKFQVNGKNKMFAIDKTVEVAEHSWVCHLRCVEATAEFLLLAVLGGGSHQRVCSKLVKTIQLMTIGCLVLIVFQSIMLYICFHILQTKIFIVPK
jgi:hypothetical protein